jgi:amino acid transporter
MTGYISSKYKTFFAALLLTGVFLLPFLVSAAGLVPCQGLGCNYCHLMQLGERIINFMIMISLPIAVVAIVAGGIFMIISGGSEAKFKQGKDIVTAAVIGVILALISWLIIGTIFQIIADPGKFPTPWNKLQCGKITLESFKQILL